MCDLHLFTLIEALNSVMQFYVSKILLLFIITIIRIRLKLMGEEVIQSSLLCE